MAQIIDIEERRKPGPARRSKVGSSPEPMLLGAIAYVGHAVPLAVIWRSWFATWSNFWLAPYGLQMNAVETPAPIKAKGRVGPSG